MQRIIRRLWVLAAWSLAACTPTVEVSTPNSVLITNVSVRDAGKALRMAEAECAKYGKHAVPLPDDRADWQKTYECKN